MVNDIEITTSTECQMVINIPTVNIVFLCESGVLPCLIEISTNESTEIVKGKRRIIWNKEHISQREVNLQIKYDVCMLKEHFPTVSCKLIIEKPMLITVEHEEQKSFYLTIIWILATVNAILITCCLLLLLKVKHKLCLSFFGNKAYIRLLLHNKETNTTATDSE
ncbi:unnamed protein product, partial [Lymnaea stagnalis]